MNIQVNGQGREIAAGSTVDNLLGDLGVTQPHVAVEVETYRPFFVLGEVTFPGQYPYVPNMTVENAIAIAGGFTPRAYKDTIKVTRQVEGSEARYELPLPMPVRPGDTITVTERWF